MLLETLTQLCATKKVREHFRDKNVYVILREYHKWEQEKTILLACENLVDILIRFLYYFYIIFNLLKVNFLKVKYNKQIT